MATPTSTTVYGRIVSNTSKSVIKSKVDKLTGFKYPSEASDGEWSNYLKCIQVLNYFDVKY